MLCQFNVSVMKFTTSDPRLADYLAAIDAIHQIAEASEGFLWRLTNDGVHPAALAFLGPHHLANLSAWTDLESLFRFVQHPWHRAIMVRRDQWFLHSGEAVSVLWDCPDEAPWPTLVEGIERLKRLRSEGPSIEAYQFAWARQTGRLGMDPGISAW